VLSAASAAPLAGLVSPDVTVTSYGSREEWLAARAFGVGGSESAVILGYSEYKSRYELYLEKRREIQPVPAGEAARWGLLHERTVAAEYARVTGRTLFDLGDFAICRRIDRPFMFATHDRIITPVDARGPGILSIKTADKSKADEWRNGAPLGYQIQLQHELSVSGFRWGSFAVLIGGNSFHWIDVDRHDRFIDLLVDECYRFACDVEQGRRPETDGSDATSEMLKRRYPRDDDTTVYLPDKASEWHREREEAMAIIKAAEKRKQLADNRLKDALGTATIGIVPGGRYRYRAHDVAEHVVKAQTKRPLVFEPAKETLQ
jgi:putative phage-type endonuclease